MHKKVRCLQVEFSEELAPYEIPAFRGAIIDKVGAGHVLFHNHLDDGKLRYKYPLIQYKRLYNKPFIFCLDEGVDIIHHLLGQPDWNLNISGRTLDIKINKLEVKQYNMQVWDKFFQYHIHHWVALNQQAYQIYQSLPGMADQVKMLESILTGNILSFAKGIDWHIDKPVTVHVKSIQNTSLIKVKGVRVMAFSLNFQTNVFLPEYIGLGKNVSIGFGMVKEIKKTAKNG